MIMTKYVYLSVFLVSVSIAESDLPELTASDQLSEISNHQSKPAKAALPELSATQELLDIRLEEPLAEYSAPPRQDSSSPDRIRLSTSDQPDSDDSFYLAAPPHLMEAARTDKE
jgi:hypothetical protein